MKPRILVISFTEHDSDPRVHRQLQLLKTIDCVVTSAGLAPSRISGISFIPLGPSSSSSVISKVVKGCCLLLGRHEQVYWGHSLVRGALNLLSGQSYDLVIANDLNTLPLACQLGCPVIFDAHEFYPEEHTAWHWRLWWGRYTRFLCRRYLPRASYMTTVSQGIADRYQREYGVTSKLLLNAPPLQKLTPSAVDSQKIRMIHHGIAARGRCLEKMVAVMRHLDQRFTLDLMLVATDPEYIDELKEMAKGDPRIRFCPPVAMADISTFINKYDLGLCLIEPTSFNNLHSLPNKFFEFIQARLGVVIGPSPEMARLVEQYQCGVVVPTFDPADVAAHVIKADIEGMKKSADIAAQELCAEKGVTVLRKLIEENI